MDNTCWPHVRLIVIQGRVHSSQHRPWVLVYKVDYSILGTLSSSLVLLNIRVVLSNTHLFYSYNIALNFPTKFRLQVKYLKTKVFHFFRAYGTFNPSPLDLSPLGSLILSPKSSWYYLSFIFNRKLSFYSHIDFYANKAISTIKCMKILSNSTRCLNPYQKCLLYRCCAILITLYGF